MQQPNKKKGFHKNVSQGCIQRMVQDECARKKKAKIPKSSSFLVRYRRTYGLNNNLLMIMP